jgi:hypothetical protein
MTNELYESYQTILLVSWVAVLVWGKAVVDIVGARVRYELKVRYG